MGCVMPRRYFPATFFYTPDSQHHVREIWGEKETVYQSATEVGMLEPDFPVNINCAKALK
jgi:hypothetical protein